MAKQLRLKLDVVALAKKAAGANAQKQDAFISTMSGETIKREFAKRCVDFILERTNEGKDKNNSSFAKYSEAYRRSRSFQIYGKSAGQVNLKLTGAMQSAVDVVDVNSRSVTLGFVDQLENDKAHGHVHGANKLPVRDFWGISEKEQIRILKQTIRDFADLEEIIVDQDELTQITVGEQELEFDFEDFDNG
jgi:hypothetical protein